MQLYLCSDTKKITEELQIVKPTVFCAVPLIYERIHAVCTEHQLSPVAALGGCVKYLFCGGAYCKPELRRYFKDAGLNLLEAYGLTETSSVISIEYPDPQDTESVGTVMENIDIRIADADENGIGEILVRGENLFAGYYANPEATAAAFDAEGFFRTGDLGRLDGRKLYLKGRKRRMLLLSNGENVYPDELEAAYAAYPQIAKVKVYVQDGQICAALYARSECDGDAVTAEVNTHLPRYAQIRKTEVIPDGIETRLK
jgi:long-chain acyl-CoA synthetase